MNPQLVFVRPSEADFETAMVFFEKVIRHTFDKNDLNSLIEEIEAEIAHKRQMLMADLSTQGKDCYFLLGKWQGRIISSISLGPAGELINKCTDNQFSTLLEVGTVFVDPAYQNKGIGGFMMNLIQEELTHRGQSNFCFDSGYPSAQKIWTKHFGPAQYIERHFWGENCPHMIWHLGVNFNPNKILPILE